MGNGHQTINNQNAIAKKIWSLNLWWLKSFGHWNWVNLNFVFGCQTFMGRLGGKTNVHILLDGQNQHVQIDIDSTTNAKWVHHIISNNPTNEKVFKNGKLKVSTAKSHGGDIKKSLLLAILYKY